VEETACGLGRAAGGRVETEVVIEARLGDPAYLAEARRNDDFIARLLGLFEPDTPGLTGEELDAEIERLLAEPARRESPAAEMPLLPGRAS
jgi:hypothetical protein